MKTETNTSLPLPRKRRASVRDRCLLGGLAVFGLMALVFWRPIQRQCLAYFLLRSDAPPPEMLTQIVQQTSHPTSLLLGLWGTGRLPHRHFVLSYLSRIADTEPDVFRALEPIAMDATSDPDLTTRELAFIVLAVKPHPQLRRLALQQLEDADPAVRASGLQALRRGANSNDVPTAIRLLSDPDPRVVVSAGLVLRQATGQDFGLKSTLALPRFTSIDHTNALPAPDLDAIGRGMEHWHAWWKDHQAEYGPSAEERHEPRQTPDPTAPDFSLESLEGKRVRLSDYRGKAVLLAFWTLEAPISLAEAPALNALHDQGVAVLGIGLPAPPSCADEHEEGDEHAHHHQHCAAPTFDTEQGRALVEQRAHEHKINFPILLDAKGAVGRRFAVEDWPTYVLIDRQGTIRRQFVGNRTGPVLEAIVSEATGPGIHASRRP